MTKERLLTVSETLGRVGVISLDIDGVIVHSAKQALKYVNKLLKSNYRLSDVKISYAMTEWLKADPNIKDPRRKDIEIWNKPEVLAYAPMVPGSLITCKILADLGHPHFFITSRPDYAAPSTKFWFEGQLPWVLWDQILVQNEGKEINLDHKINRIIEKKVAFHFEDSLSHAQEIVENTNARVVLVRHPWNLSYQNEDPRIIAPDGSHTSLLLSFREMLVRAE